MGKAKRRAIFFDQQIVHNSHYTPLVLSDVRPCALDETSGTTTTKEFEAAFASLHLNTHALNEAYFAHTNCSCFAKITDLLDSRVFTRIGVF